MSSLYRLFRQYTHSTATATNTGRVIRAFVRDNKNRNLRNFVEEFKKSCEDDCFRTKKGVYEYAIHRLAGAKCFHWIKDIIEDQKKYKDISEEGFNVRLITLYGKSGMLSDAHKLFDEMPLRNCKRTVLSFNSLLAAYYSKKFDKVDELFRELPKKLDIEPDLVSYNILVKAFCEMGSLELGILFLDELERKGTEPNLVTFNTLLNAFYENRRFLDAEGIWLRMVEKNLSPDARSYNAKLRGLALERKTEDAAKLFEEMRNNGIKPDVITFTALIKGFVNKGNLLEAKRWYDEIGNSGCKPDSLTFAILIHFACNKGDLGFAFQLSKDALKRKCLVDGSLLQRVVDELAKEGNIEQAKKLLQRGSKRYKLKLPPNLEGPQETL